MGLDLVSVSLTMGISVWLMVHLFPDSPFVQAIQPLAGYGLIGWLFSDSLVLPLALASGQVVFWIGVKALRAAAVRRLEGWKEC